MTTTAEGPSTTISVAPVPEQDWDQFVTKANAPIYLRAGWSLLAREVFGHRAFFISARDPSSALVGVLPLVQQKSLRDNFSTSVPFFNYGGAVASDPAVARAL